MNKLQFVLPILIVICLGSFAQQQVTTTAPGVNCNQLENIEDCKSCVMSNCTFVQEEFSSVCTNSSGEYDQFTIWVAHNVSECQETTTSTTTKSTPIPASNSTTTTTKPTPTTTTPTTTNSTTTTTVPTPTTLPPNTTTTTVPTTTPLPTNGTTTTTTTAPTNGTTPTTTAIPPTTPKPAPSSGFAWGTFFSGIIFTAGIGSVAYVVWRFYKVRTERNYHTL